MLSNLAHIVIFLLMNAIVAASAYLLTLRAFRLTDFIDSLICFITLYLSQIILTETILGILGVLYIEKVIVASLAILFTILLLTRKLKSLFSQNMITLLFKKQFPRDRVIFLVLMVLTVFGGVKVLTNLLNPPFGWDSLNYHFTFAVEWLKHGNLETPITVFDDPSPSYYPINGSLFYLWLIFPLKNVFLADLGQLPFFILALLSVYNISRKLGLKREYALFAAGLFMLIPNFFKQIQIAYLDVMVAGLFLAALDYLFNLNEDFSLKNTLIYSLSLGLLMGTKTIGLPYGFLLFVPFIYLCFKNTGRLYLFPASLAIVFLLGGFSYLRNFLEAANPLYPLQFNLLGKSIFKGAMDINTYSAHFKNTDYSLSKMLFHEGLGAQTILFVFPSLFLALPVALAKQRKELSFLKVYCLVLPISIYLVYRFLIPLANLRYLYALLAIGLILGFYILDRLRAPKLLVKSLVVVCILASVPELAKRQELITSIILTIVVLLLAKPITLFLKAKRNIFNRHTAIFLGLILLGTLVYLEKWYEKNEFPRYAKMVKYSGFWPDAARAWDWLNNNTCGNNIAYAGRPVPFPLYGTNFKNNVYYVSLNKVEPVKLHYFPKSRYDWGCDFMSLHESLEKEGNYRSGANYSIWLNNLGKRNTDFLFIYSLHQAKTIKFPVEDEWAESHPEKFLPVFNNATMHIYKVNK